MKNDILTALTKGTLHIDALAAQLGAGASRKTLRNILSTMTSKGEISRVGRGAYCLPGQEPDLRAWILADMARIWPDFHDKESLADAYYDRHKIKIPKEKIAAELETIRAEGENWLNHYSGAFTFWDNPGLTKPDSGQTRD